jgi:hypothetical protein
MKLTTFVPIPDTEQVLAALFAAGAGQIGDYKNCSFRTEGVGTFRPTGAANPHIGHLDRDESVQENRIEVIFETFKESKVLAALRAAHPYEEVAYYLHLLENENQTVGSGLFGYLKKPMAATDFLHFLKKQMGVGALRYTNYPLSKKVEKIAVCGGSGSFLLNHAIAVGADVFVTADYKYHEFFDADGRIIIADIGHFESEQFTINLLKEVLMERFENLTVFSTENISNPVNYL